MQSLLSGRDISFEFPNGHILFKSLSFNLKSNLTALVGPNGVGKSTFAQLLAGHLQVTSGQINRNTSVTLFPQRQKAEPIAVCEFLQSPSSWNILREKLLAGIDQDLLCTQLSGGQWMRVRLAQILDLPYVILDEPTNDLDQEGRQALYQFLQERTDGALLISHDRECLSLCNEILELSNQGLSKFGGSWPEYQISKAQEREGLSANLELAKKSREKAHMSRQEKISRQEKRNRQGARAGERGGLPKILLGARKRRAQVTSGRVDADTYEKAQQAVKSAFEAFSQMKQDPLMYANLRGEKNPQQKLIAEAKDYNIHFADWIYKKDLNFSWRGNIRLCLRGENGTGKSTLLKSIMGENFSSRGTLRTGVVSILYVDQKYESLNENKSLYENIRDSSGLSESDIRNNLAPFLFTKNAVFQKVSTLSGGERLRACLAQGLMQNDRPQLLILDEPTNNLDLANIEFLEQIIRTFQGAVIIISHDETFLSNCALDEEFVL